MNTAHWHLTLNHFPIVGIIIGTLVLLYGFVFKNNPSIKRTALGIFIFSAFSMIPVYLTGEGAEEAVEKMPGVTENIIEKHEDLGKIFLIVCEALGIISLITLMADWKKFKLVPVLYVFILFGSIGTCVVAQQIGTSGGEIRHTEIRNENQLPMIEGEMKNDEEKD